jgi:hypothetical protein
MWVYDGEQWTNNEDGDQARPESPARPRYDELMPELQVVEIVPVPMPRPGRDVPPLPLP